MCKGSQLKLTLLVENNEQLESFYSLNLLTWVGASVITKKEAKFCIKVFEDHPDIACIITKARNGLEKSAEALYEYLQQLKIKIPLIVIGKSTIEDPNVIHLSNGLDIKPLIQAAAKSLGVTAQDMVKLNVPEYFPFPINYFRVLRRSTVDVFEEMPDNKGHYQLRLKEYEDFEADLIKNYIGQGISELYVKKNDRLKFVTNVTQELVAKIEASELNDDEQIAATEMGQKLLSQKLLRLGINEETTKLAEKQMKMMTYNANKFPKMSRLLARLLNNKTGYLYKHLQLLTYIGHHLMDNIDWGNEDQKKKIAFVAFFHDIMLENDEQAMIHSEAELKASTLEAPAKDLINKHAQLAAEMIQKYPHAPMGTDVIIRQHHGIAHGIGFSTTYGGNLSPMTIVFILAEDLTDRIIRSGHNLDYGKVIEQMREKFPTQRFQKIIDIMEKITV
jgi:hypothetical protein